MATIFKSILFILLAFSMLPAYAANAEQHNHYYHYHNDTNHHYHNDTHYHYQHYVDDRGYYYPRYCNTEEQWIPGHWVYRSQFQDSVWIPGYSAWVKWCK